MKGQNEADDPRRRLLVQALTVGVFSGASLGASAQVRGGFFGSQPARLPPEQSIFRLQGGATVNGSNATLQTRIGPSDTVETSRDGEIVFVVGANSFILRGGSKLELSARQQDSAILSGLRMLTGKLLSVTRNNSLQFTTATATVGIRGTGVYLEADPAETYFCTCYGVADVVANDDPESRDTVAATHHDRPLYIVAGQDRGRNIRPAGFRNHTDQELMLIETLVGRTPPFVFPGGAYSAPRREY